MVKHDSERVEYFYAGGERVPLHAATAFCAVDMERIEKKQLLGAVQKLIKAVGASTRRGIAVFSSSDVPRALYGQLEAAACLQPVYQEGSTLIVVLPEIRIEDSRPEMQDQIKEWIGQQRRAVTSRDRGDRIEVRPTSGSGLEALRMANEIHENMTPELVQARMLRLRPKPGKGD